ILRFPRVRRLRKRRDFLKVQGAGAKAHTRHFLVLRLAQEAQLPRGRLGITVTKRVGSAATRNRIKRLVREFVRQNPGWLPNGVDVVVVAKKSAAKLGGLMDVANDLGPAGAER
ncbi:MAG: ribonuclease P protein component, partial [Deltaproteobacteria bacterium]|nr:ribonuclease P protein component [Deltaproteobacteria bacterium]